MIITSKKSNAVLVSESEWESMVETMYLLRTPANRERLAGSQAEVLAGDLYEYQLPITKTSEGKKASRPVRRIALPKTTPKSKKKVAAAKVAKKAKKETSA